MILRTEVDRVLKAAEQPLTPSEVRMAIQERTGHTVRVDTVRLHLYCRTKFDVRLAGEDRYELNPQVEG